MKKLTLSLLLLCSFSQALADIIKSAPTSYPMLDYILLLGVFAVVVLLVVRRIRKRRQM